MKNKGLLVRIFGLAAAAALALTCVGCAGEQGGSSGGTKPNVPDVAADEITFPLEEPVTFSIMIDNIQSTTFKDQLANNAVWKKWKEETNVDMDFVFLGLQGDAASQFALLVNARTYGDCLSGGPILNSIMASLYYRQGTLVPITQYVNEEYMPNFMERVVKENPNVIKNSSAMDGEMICLPEYKALEGQFLESPIWINKAWLDKLHLQIPKTIDEFENVLRHFKEDDPNGNGKQDEIPLMIAESTNWSNFEPWLGIFGVATKTGTNDAYVQVKNGKVEFQPTSEGYKEGIKWLRKLKQSELIYGDAFTADVATAEARLTSETCVVGVYTQSYRYPALYKDDYICIDPPTAPGYTPCWFYHSGINGTKNMFFVTDKCENTGVLMKWLDRLYDFESTVAFAYNNPGDGYIEEEADGKIWILDLDVKTSNRLAQENPTLASLTHLYCNAFTKDDYENKFILDYVSSDRKACYEQYKQAGVINTELWPRPYLVGEDAYTVSDISTELFNEVSTFFANSIEGYTDPDAEWDSYLKKCKAYGVDEYVDALQRAYDAYINN